MRWREPALSGLGVLGMLLLVGCGSSGPPPLLLACASHRLPSGLVRVSVKLTNSTAIERDALLYGSALRYVRYEYPVLQPRQVVVEQNGQKTPFLGLVVQHLGPNKTVTELLRFQVPPGQWTFSVATGTHVKGVSASGTAAGNTSCHISDSG